MYKINKIKTAGRRSRKRGKILALFFFLYKNVQSGNAGGNIAASDADWRRSFSYIVDIPLVLNEMDSKRDTRENVEEDNFHWKKK